jgi:hypothetical protein
VGGILVIGVGEPKRAPNRALTGPWIIDPIPPADLHIVREEAILRLLHQIAPMLYPPPRIIPVAMDEGGFIVIVAVERAPALVWVTENSLVHHYFRFGESTLAAPDYLVQDLILRRRARAVLSVAMVGNPGSPMRDERLLLNLTMVVTNESIVHLDGVVAGLVHRPMIRRSGPLLPRDLAAAITTQVDHESALYTPRHEPLEIVGQSAEGGVFLAPFTSCQLSGLGIQVAEASLIKPHAEMIWEAGLYVLGRDQPARWWQVVSKIGKDGRPRPECMVEPLHSGRPIVRTTQS